MRNDIQGRERQNGPRWLPWSVALLLNSEELRLFILLLGSAHPNSVIKSGVENATWAGLLGECYRAFSRRRLYEVSAAEFEKCGVSR